MSLRGVWIYKPYAPANSDKILFSRRFAPAECRAKRQRGYVSLEEEQELCTAVFTACGLAEADEEYTKERDSCLVESTKPIYEVGAKKQWPFVAIMRHSLLFCALPVVDNTTSAARPSAIELPGVTVAIDFLEKMAAYVGPSAQSWETTDSQVNDLYNTVGAAMPFGTPIRTELAQVDAMLATKPPPPSGKSKQPAWKPFSYKGNNRVTLALQERVKAAQYDRAEVTDVIQVTGDIRCRAELEANPELTVGVMTPPNCHPISYLLVHPCVQNSEAHPARQPSSPRSTSPLPVTSAAATATATVQLTRKMTLHPPADLFTLCQYKAEDPPLPIRGFYQMKGDRTVKLLVQLKLAAGVKNSFDFCELRLPFFNRPPVSNVEFLPRTAQVAISPNQRTLIWTIGQKFPSRSLEVSLNATVTFQDDVAGAGADGGGGSTASATTSASSSSTATNTSTGATAASAPAADGAAKTPSGADEFVEDPFCVGLNAYAELNFRILDHTLSGCMLDPKAVSLYPNSRYKLSLSRELVADGYKIWNSHGDARVAKNPSNPAATTTATSSTSSA
ncbi:AP-5 complex subunit mu-1-like [Sycon ciliatum]|uniref:AP-5 complex subunit mu-1-like n=1 Tax=Sycon ciliatum TaxID=27933 RepID=UPI0031F63473